MMMIMIIYLYIIDFPPAHITISMIIYKPLHIAGQNIVLLKLPNEQSLKIIHLWHEQSTCLAFSCFQHLNTELTVYVSPHRSYLLTTNEIISVTLFGSQWF